MAPLGGDYSWAYAYAVGLSVYLSIYLVLAIGYARLYVAHRSNLLISSRGLDLVLADLLVNIFWTVVICLRDILLGMPERVLLPCWVMQLALALVCGIYGSVIPLRGALLLLKFDASQRQRLGMARTYRGRMFIMFNSTALCLLLLSWLIPGRACLGSGCNRPGCIFGADYGLFIPTLCMASPISMWLARRLGAVNANREATGMMNELVTSMLAVILSLSLNGGIILSLDLGHINSAGWNALSGFLTLMLAATFFISGHAMPCHSFGYRPLLVHALITVYHFLIGDEDRESLLHQARAGDKLTLSLRAGRCWPTVAVAPEVSIDALTTPFDGIIADRSRTVALLEISRVVLAEEATRFVLGFCRLRKMPIDTPEMREEVRNACKTLLDLHFGTSAPHRLDVRPACEELAVRKIGALCRRKYLFRDDCHSAINAFNPAFLAVHLRVEQLLQRRLLDESFTRGQQDDTRRISGGKEVLPLARGGESLDGPAGDQLLTPRSAFKMRNAAGLFRDSTKKIWEVLVHTASGAPPGLGVVIHDTFSNSESSTASSSEDFVRASNLTPRSTSKVNIYVRSNSMISQRTSEVAPELSNPPAPASGTDSGGDKGSHSPPSLSSQALSLPALWALEGGGAAVLQDTPPSEHKQETGGGGTLEHIVVQAGGHHNPQEPPQRQQSQNEDKGEGSLPAP